MASEIEKWRKDLEIWQRRRRWCVYEINSCYLFALLITTFAVYIKKDNGPNSDYFITLSAINMVFLCFASHYAKEAKQVCLNAIKNCTDTIEHCKLKKS